jgi:predicted hotdog family 3-hydroxylacyl-ACP dehydratase
MGRMRIISVEVLIGFKLQSFVNDATRTRDLDDIRALLKTHRASLHMDELRGYFPCSINRNSSMNLSDSTNANTQTAPNRADAGAGAVLVREAGLPFQPPLGNASGIDPIA